ncbi:alpha-ketoglutarate-dependent dioxygenase alkB homolog 4-like [Argonauta hians]
MKKDNKRCSCKGIRTCLLCEDPSNNTAINHDKHQTTTIYTYCNKCQKAWQDTTTTTTTTAATTAATENPPPPHHHHHHRHPDHAGVPIDYPGIFLEEDFISAEEEDMLTNHIDQTPFVDSQSGRRKQDYGPKVNFKKQKVNCRCFTGLPSFSKFLVDRFTSRPELSGFVPVELCNLEYEPSRGSAIDPHFDDFWIWGERLVTVNLLSHTYLTMSRDEEPNVQVRIPLPRRSLVVVYGPARYQWKHAVHRQDVTSRRLAMTFREPTSDFLSGGVRYYDVGERLIKTALTFQGVSVAQMETASTTAAAVVER